jgi:hypothetical protein
MTQQHYLPAANAKKVSQQEAVQHEQPVQGMSGSSSEEVQTLSEPP